MGKTTKIEWADASWNPWMGCTKVSEGCRNCYAERQMKRFGRDFSYPTRTSDATFYGPLKWKESKTVFVCSWSDFCHERVKTDWLDDAWHVMRRANHHRYLILTKRPEIMKYYLPDDWGNVGWDHVAVGVTVEHEDEYWRLTHLENISACLRFVSAEPLLGPLWWLYSYFPSLDWVIVGGESGPNRRPMDLDWVRSIRNQCVEVGVPFFFKQAVIDGKMVKMPELDGKVWDQTPWATAGG